MKGECDVPSIKPKYEPSNEINLYSYVHQAILMPEDGKHFTGCLIFNFYFKICIGLYFKDFMFDKEDDIEILSTKSQNTSNRTESRNVDDWYAISYLYTN